MSYLTTYNNYPTPKGKAEIFGSNTRNKTTSPLQGINGQYTPTKEASEQSGKKRKEKKKKRKEKKRKEKRRKEKDIDQLLTECIALYRKLHSSPQNLLE